MFQEKLAEMWTASNMRWEQFVNSEDVEEFVKSNVSILLQILRYIGVPQSELPIPKHRST